MSNKELLLNVMETLLGLKEEFEKIHTKQAEHDSRLDNLDAELKAINKRISGLEEKVRRNMLYVESVLEKNINSAFNALSAQIEAYQSLLPAQLTLSKSGF
ncbi:MAG: hypothetical protein LBR54_04575 [Oscillospiraceae bacterium]|jgi:uncharacterized coiled-coil DUF342 family protein|nr:hypothetical protein [Oscillospiraceae bacterium]